MISLKKGGNYATVTNKRRTINEHFYINRFKLLVFRRGEKERGET